MKRILIPFALVLSLNASMAQSQPSVYSTPFPKTITVSGSAEMEIIPDEIYVNVDLQEYQKKGQEKKDLEAIKTAFLESCKAAGIADSAISIVSYSGFNNYYYIRKRKKNPDLFASITYQVKFKSSDLMDRLVERLDDDATQNFIIVSTSHSKITEFRKQLKIQAVKAAKEKGIYLTEAIGEKLGEAITVNEPDVNINGFYLANELVSNNAYLQYKGQYRDEDKPDNDKVQEVDFKKIKLRFEVTVIFALK